MATIQVYFIAMDNAIPQLTKSGFNDVIGITTNPDVLAGCPGNWQHIKTESWTQGQLDAMVHRLNDDWAASGGWDEGWGTTRNLLEAIEYMTEYEW